MSSQNFISRPFSGTTAIFFKGDAFWTKLTLQCYIGNKPITSHMPKGSVTLRESFYNNQHFPAIIIEEKSQKLPNIGVLSCLYYLWKINGPEHVKVITAPYTDPDQPARPDHNHHMATQSSPLHTEKTVTWLRRCAGWAQSSMSTHLPRIPLSGSIDFKVTSLEIIYVTKSTYEIVKRAQYSHLALNIKLQWNNVRKFCLKNNLQLILISITWVYAN